MGPPGLSSSFGDCLRLGDNLRATDLSGLSLATSSHGCLITGRGSLLRHGFCLHLRCCSTDGCSHLVVTFPLGGEAELDLTVLTNIIRINCGNLNGLAFRPADLWLIARGQVEADHLVLLIRRRRPIDHIVEAADGRRVNVRLHHIQDLCFLLDGVKGVEGVCLLFGLQEDLALRLLRGDLPPVPFPGPRCRTGPWGSSQMPGRQFPGVTRQRSGLKYRCPDTPSRGETSSLPSQTL